MFEFWVNLLLVSDTDCNDSRMDLYANCTHIMGDFWLMEGDTDALYEGITFEVIGNPEPMEGYGDLTGAQLKQKVFDAFGPEIRDFMENRPC